MCGRGRGVTSEVKAAPPFVGKPQAPEKGERSLAVMADLLQSLSKSIDVHYPLDKTAGWTYSNLWIPPLACVAYLVVIFSGKKWMQKREACKVNGLLTLWNTLLALFSIIGFLSMFPPIVEDLINDGYISAVCNSQISTRPYLSMWAYFFVLSKIVEFGDTVFIVIRKTPLSFLHWYHHVTVLLYSWYGLATRNSAGHWFSAINLGVHAVMYSYYMLKALGFRIPASVAKCITILQLTQFVIGLVLVFTAVWMRYEGRECKMNDTHIRAGFIMYGSYFVLFLNFFYRRYIQAQPKKKKE